MLKQVKYVIPAEKIDMGGFPIKQALPTQQVSQVDPFLLVHHGKVKYSSRRSAKHQGVDPHPHRGFSPVTFVIQGEVHHRDSRGNNQIAKAGEIQWMNAGRGIIHSERPSQKMAEEGGHQEIIQIWINSPAASKMKVPVYFHIDQKGFKNTESADGFISTKVLDHLGESPIKIYWAESKTGGHETYDIPADFNAILYVVNGQLNVKGHGLVDSESLVVFEQANRQVQIEAKSDSQFIILSGMPLNEKVVQSGPFVMNSETEILEAMRDYRMGKMGILIEE